VPAEHVHLELGAQHLRLQILDRAWLAIGAVVEESGELALGRCQHLVGSRGHRRGLGVIETETLDPLLLAQALDVLVLARGREHAPAACLHLARGSEPDAGRAAGDEDRSFRHDAQSARAAFLGVRPSLLAFLHEF
jgi:hypothetical protein